MKTMHHLSHTQVVAFSVTVVLVVALWTWLWAWIWWMALRVLRWTYLEKKYGARVETWHAGGDGAGVGSGEGVYSGPGWPR